MTTTLKKPFTWLQKILYAGIFVVVFRLLQVTSRKICDNLIPFDCAYYWPISIFEVRLPSLVGYVTAGAVTLTFFLFVKYLESKRYAIGLSCLLGVLLISGSTLIQGVADGLYAPVAGYSQESVISRTL